MIIKKLFCRVFGHDWRYNFKSLPNKAICKRCKCKSQLDLRSLEWHSIQNFENDFRTDQELCNNWHSL